MSTKGWEYAPLAKVCDVFTDGDWIEKKDQAEDGIRLIQTGNIGEGVYKDRLEKSRYISESTFDRLKCTEIHEGDCLVSRLPDPVGRACILPDSGLKMITAVDCTIIRLDKERCLPEFFTYYTQSESYLRDVDIRCTGATRKRISRKNLGKIEIPLPPLPEQRRIVSVLDAAFAGLATATANTQKNLQNANSLFDSKVHALFAQRGKGWTEQKLGDIGKVAMCKRIFKKQTADTGDIPFYKIGTFGKEANAYISNDIYEDYRSRYSFPKEGDVLISAAGTIGRRVRYDGEPAYFQDSNIVWIDNDETQVLNDYLYHFYGACEWNSTTGATISRLYNDDLRRIVVPFPKSFDEQERISKTLDTLVIESQQLESIYQRKLAALEELKKSILHRAFRGELSGDGSTIKQLAEVS